VLILAATLTAAEVIGIAVLPGVLLLGVAGVGAVVAIGSALIAYSARRTRTREQEDTPQPAHR
jgi:hypothetical protein